MLQRYVKDMPHHALLRLSGVVEDGSTRAAVPTAVVRYVFQLERSSSASVMNTSVVGA